MSLRRAIYKTKEEKRRFRQVRTVDPRVRLQLLNTLYLPQLVVNMVLATDMYVFILFCSMYWGLAHVRLAPIVAWIRI